MLSFIAIRKVRAQYPTIKNELLQLASVKNVTASSSSISFVEGWTDGVEWEGKNPEAKPIFQQLVVDHDFLKTYSIPISAGRDFSTSVTSDSSAILLNEEAVAQMNLADPVNKVITLNEKKIQRHWHCQKFSFQINPQ